jgi:protein-S-isoprenylcysteine O-methyltransferase Ste14
MTQELVFVSALNIIFIATWVIQAYFGYASKKSGYRVTYKESKRSKRIGTALQAFMWIMWAAFLDSPSSFEWSTLSLPSWSRWIGLGIGALSCVFLYVSHLALGSNFSPILHLRERHELVQNGPYRWIRHPIYVSLILMFLSCFLLSANWLV